MDSLSASQLNHQYTKVATYLKEQNKLLKKYRDFSQSVQKTITEGIKNGRFQPYQFPSLDIEVKQNDKLPMNENTLKEFLNEIYSDHSIREIIIHKFQQFRKSRNL